MPKFKTKTSSASFKAMWVAMITSLGIATLGNTTESDSGLRKLTRLQAIQLGVNNNLQLLSERLERDAAKAMAEGAYRPFVPMVDVNLDYRDHDSTYQVPGNNPDHEELASNHERERRTTYATGARWLTPLGTEFTTSIKVDQALTGQANPYHSTSWQATLRQPLLKGRGRIGASSGLLLSELGQRVQEQLFASQLNAFIVRVDQAYWALVFAQADVATKLRSHKRAKEQFEETQQHIKNGVLAQAEIYVVEENLVFFQQQLLHARENLVLAKRNVANMLNWSAKTNLLAVDKLDEIDVHAANVADPQQVIRLAMEGNPHLQAKRLSLEMARIESLATQNQSLPSLDLQIGVSLHGLDRTYGQSWQNMVGTDSPEGYVGMQFAIPLDPDPDRALEQAAQIQIRKQRELLTHESNQLRFQIEDLATEIKAQTERLALAKRLLKLAQLKLEAEMEKYASGISTLADVVRFQRDLDSAAMSLRTVQVGLMVRRSRLLAAQGDLSKTVGIEVL